MADEANLLDEVVHALEAHAPFCLIGGQAVNAYVEPLVSLDLDVVVAAYRHLAARVPDEVRRHLM